jgi:hypothetical protein
MIVNNYHFFYILLYTFLKVINRFQKLSTDFTSENRTKGSQKAKIAHKPCAISHVFTSENRTKKRGV